MRWITLFTLLLFITTQSLLAQNKKAELKEDKLDLPFVVQFKDGSVVKGKIISFLQGGDLHMLVAGEEVVFPADEILKLRQNSSRANLRKALKRGKYPYAFKEKGIYHASAFMVNIGSMYDDNAWGFGLQHASGYQFNRWIGVGAGVGLDAYAINNENPILSFFADARGYFKATRVTPFYSVQVGYGKMLDKQIRDVQGGLMVYPSLGVRLSGLDGANFFVDLGYKYQKSKREYENSWWWQSYEIWDYKYHRYVLRFGLTF